MLQFNDFFFFFFCTTPFALLFKCIMNYAELIQTDINKLLLIFSTKNTEGRQLETSSSFTPWCLPGRWMYVYFRSIDSW